MTDQNRPSKTQMFMQMADVVKYRSTCGRLAVGAIITDREGTTVLAMGYNGNARNLPNGCDSTEPGKCGCIHAEVNVMLKSQNTVLARMFSFMLTLLL